MKISGIYRIESKVKPERVYIGSSINIGNRWRRHLSTLKLKQHGSIKLQNHVNKYGIDDLIFTIITECEKVDLIKTEQSFINSYNPYFNICKIAGSSLGVKRSDEYRKAKREFMKGNTNGFGHCQSEEMKLKSKTNCFHPPLSDEHKRKIGIAAKGNKYNLGKKASEETKQKMRIASLKNGSKPPSAFGNKYNLGKHHSQETINKMCNSQKLRRLKEIA